MTAINSASPRTLTPALRAFERDFRRKGYFSADERFLDCCAGTFIALYERGALSSDRPHSRLPWIKDQVVAAFTNRMLLFVGQRFVRNCSLATAVRTEVYESRMRFLFSTEPTRRLSMLEMTPPGARAEEFIENLQSHRNALIASVPDLTGHVEAGVEQIRSVPSAEVLETLVLGPWEPHA